ncbi:complex proteins associated with Set1p component shg1-domain-containing protein [Zychaea mexicana]|uniref:complex proteins associated with Set1p component shg1-domain-containing protein n=1 Tax=Zychaea mexicana TaxID=64656 RepID=UPI0022FEF5A6|nr:complex proteins associated with Set1p component shg1-domain-containing protein [Zychaea mexicana]KAI9498525.1 complex proteins associated with Set1p component shg1-domain-containing protein [Zychaea mexicana]
MTPDEIVLQLKRKGTFDQLRKHLLSEFQQQNEGQKFLENVTSFMQEKISKDPSLLDKERSTFQSLMMNELEKAGMFQSVHEQIRGTLLQQKYYQDQVDEQLRLVLDASKDE